LGLVKKVRRAPGQALSDFNIFKLVADAWGCTDLFQEWESPEAVFQIMKRLSVGQPCDISGIRDYQALDEAGGRQWPWPAGTTTVETERRLFADGRFYHPNGKARFIFSAPRPWAEPPDATYPFLLLTGRGTSSQWHTQTRTSKSDVLRKLYPQEVYLEINPLDAERLQIKSREPVLVRSRRGEVKANAFVTPTIQPGQVFLPMHYATVNQLTYPEVDPYSRQPNYKACAVAVQSVRERKSS
jgi:anaerobic selenocysteine-containing dehydrogenase